MTQSDHNLANQTFPSGRTELNTIFESIQTMNSGATAPTATFPGMLWIDTANSLIEQRNQADSAWITLGHVDKNGWINTNAGDPNGSITGQYEGELLYDSTNDTYWIYSGSSTVWYTIGGFGKYKIITNSDSPYTLTKDVRNLDCNATSGAITVNLYTAAGNAGREVTITKTDSSTNAITIDGNSTETIDGALTYTLYTQYDSVTIYSDGTNWKVKGGLPRKQLIQTQTASSVASVDFTIGINSTFDRYLIELVNITAATDQVQLLLRTTTDGGSTWDSGATDYRVSNISPTGTVAADGTAISLVNYVGSTGGYLGNAAGESLSGEVLAYNPSGTTNQKLFKYHTCWNDSGGNIEHLTGAGERNATADVDGIRFFMSSGNIASGTFRLYGLR